MFALKKLLSFQWETASPSKILLNQISELLRTNQLAGALCNFHWVLHMAERGFLKRVETMMLVQQRQKIMLLLDKGDRHKLYERLIKLSDIFELYGEKVEIEHELFDLKQNEAPFTAENYFIEPNQKNYDRHIDTLNQAISARRTLIHISGNKLQSVEQENTIRCNKLEIQCQYDLIVPIYIEQLTFHRNKSAKEVATVLKNVLKFAKILQTQSLYKQAQTLYYLTLETLNTNQSFYEKSYLKEVDEQFLLEGLCKLQRSCLESFYLQSKENQLATKYFWSENLTALQQLRLDKKAIVDKLMSTLDELRYTTILIENVESLQHDITQSMKGFFTRLFKQAESLLGDPPCDYCLMALGSIARGDMTPFSDLESVLLVEKLCSKGSLETLYFESLWKLVAFQIKTLGESDDENPGIHIDAECHPLLPSLMTTPETLIESYGLKAITTDQYTEGILALTLLNSTVLYTSEDETKSNKIWEQYHRLLNETLKTSKISNETTSVAMLLRHRKAKEQLTAVIEKFKTNPMPDFQIGCSVKNDFLGPLAYLLTDLSLYHHLDETNLITILKRLVEINILDPLFVHNCRAAIAELNLWRLHLHLKHNQAKDIFPKDLPTHQQIRLKQIWQGLINPLYEAVSQLIDLEHPYHPVLDKLQQTKVAENAFQELIPYLLYTQSLDEPTTEFIEAYHRLPMEWQFLFFQQLEEITHWDLHDSQRQKTLSILATQINPDGWRPQMELEQRVWMHDIASLFEPMGLAELMKAMKQENIIVYMPSGIGLKAYAFKTEVFKQLFNPDGTLRAKPDTQPGRHLVLQVKYRDKAFWFKFRPEQAGTEYAISRLERYLGGQGTPMTQIMKLCHGCNPGMAVQISEHVPGDTLEESLKHYPEHVMQINSVSFTQSLLRVLLSNPEDDKGDDYFLVPTHDGKHFKLIRIDNERAYYQPDVSQGLFKKSKQLQVKSLLYCLDQMFLPLDQNTLDAFLRLDIYALLEHWLKDQIYEQDCYSRLFNEEEIRGHFHHKDPDPSILGLPMAEGLTKELLTRLYSIQQVSRIRQKHKQMVTGIDLLKVVQPSLVEYYESAFATHPIPQGSHEESSIMETFARKATNILKRFDTVTQGLYYITVQGHRQSIYPTTKALRQSLHLETDLTERDVIAIAQGKKMSPYQALERLKQLQKIQAIDMEFAGMPFHELTLSHFHEVLIDDQLISYLIGAHKHLMTLDLSGCSLLTNRGIEAIAQWCPHLEELKLKDIHNPANQKAYRVEFIERRNKFISMDNLSFPCLKRLESSGCKQLRKIHLRAPLLEVLFANDCPQLHSVETDSMTLIRAEFQGNQALNEEGLEHLTPSPEGLKILTLAGCDSLMHTNFRERYPELGTELLNVFSTLEMDQFTSWLEEALEKSGHSWEALSLTTVSASIESVRSFCSIRRKFSQRIIQRLLVALGEDSKVRKTAADTLEQLAKTTPSIIDTLVALGDVQGSGTRPGTALALGQLAATTPWLIDVLLKALRNGCWRPRQNAVLALGQSGVTTPSVIDALLRMLNDEVLDIRISAAQILVQLDITTPPVIDVLLKALRHEYWPSEVVSILGQSGVTKPLVTDALLKMLWNENSSLNTTVVKALMQLRITTPKVIDAFLQELRRGNSRNREAVALALGQLAKTNPSVIDALLKLIKLSKENNSRAKNVRKAAALALGQSGVTTPPVIDALLKEVNELGSPNIKVHAASALGHLGVILTPSLIDHLLFSLRYRDTDTVGAASALGHLAGSIPTEILYKLLEDKDSTVRVATTSALIQTDINKPHVNKAFLNALKNENTDVRIIAASALRQLDITTPQVINALLRALGDENSEVRKNAALTLGKLDVATPQVINALLRALGDREPIIISGWKHRACATLVLGKCLSTKSLFNRLEYLLKQSTVNLTSSTRSQTILPLSEASKTKREKLETTSTTGYAQYGFMNPPRENNDSDNESSTRVQSASKTQPL